MGKLEQETNPFDYFSILVLGVALGYIVFQIIRSYV